MDARLDRLIQQTSKMKAHQWIARWVALCRLIHMPCYQGKDVRSWTAWQMEVVRIPADVETSLVAEQALSALQPYEYDGSAKGYNLHPYESVMWDYLIEQDGYDEAYAMVMAIEGVSKEVIEEFKESGKPKKQYIL